MQKLFRFSFSSFFGFLIAAGSFVAMLHMIGSSTTPTVSDNPEIKFTFVKAFEAPKEEPPKPLEEPELKPVTQPPAAPTLDVTTPDKPVLRVPLDGIQAKPNLISELPIPGNNVGPGDLLTDQGSGLKTAIPPMYPPEAMMSQTEGWVKVKITVNEFGRVSDVDVIEAQPRRVFDAAAKKAVRKWQFYPKKVNGQAVGFIATQTIEFNLEQ